MSDRAKMISKLKTSKLSRAAYMKGKLSVLIPAQIRALRLKSETPKQEDLAKEAEMKQSRISAVETPGAVNFNLETLIRLASALKVALLVKFVPFSDMLKWENEFNQDRFDVVTIDNDAAFALGEGETVIHENSIAQQNTMNFTQFSSHLPTRYYLDSTDSTANVRDGLPSEVASAGTGDAYRYAS